MREALGAEFRRSSTITRMTPPSLTRREFLQSTAAAGTGFAAAHVAPHSLFGETAVAPATSDVAPAWAMKPMRWMQLTLVEDDPGIARFVAKRLRETAYAVDVVRTGERRCILLQPLSGMFHAKLYLPMWQEFRWQRIIGRLFLPVNREHPPALSVEK